MNLYLDLRVISAVPDAYKQDAKALMQLSGANIGNYAFRHGLSSLTDLTGYSVMAYSEAQHAIAIEQPGRVLVSCANWLSATPDYERGNGVRASIIDKVQGPVVSFGLGAQASHGAATLELGPNTQRLAHVLAGKCQSLSVRDQFTAEVLDGLGIRNLTITGCPSNFINLDPTLGARVLARCDSGAAAAADGWTQVRSHISEYSGGHAFSGRVLKATLEVLGTAPGFYVVQSPVLMPFVLGESRDVPADYVSNAPESMRGAGNVGTVLRRSALHFSSIEAWLDFARSCDVAFGMRIHGSMIPLQAGTPSLVIGHDSRTSGLAGFMGIPTLSPEAFLDTVQTGPAKLFEVIAAGMESYDRRRAELGRTMKAYLEGNGVPCSNALLNFCNQAQA